MNSAISRLLDLRLLDSLEWGVSGVPVRGQLAPACHGGKWELKSVSFMYGNFVQRSSSFSMLMALMTPYRSVSAGS
jgi:hypothetical protein